MGVREERRAAVEAEILRVGREHLARYGAAAISLRSIARDLGMVSSGIYRYVDSRDELLTRLVVSAFTSLAHAVTEAHDRVCRVDPADLDGRWVAIASTLRSWAVEHPHDFALVYGSPVPGYAAPAERTSGPGTAVVALLTQLLDDAARLGRVPSGAPAEAAVADRAVGDFLEDAFFDGTTLTPDVLARGLSAWTLLLGAVTAEVFNQLGPVADTAALFEWHLEAARRLFLTPPERA